ncbi:uncharacterized protein LOC128678373 [Plodia interpunctella]|uniref:uncharacterized protein LOC128678373 n=1 Tax=Plodia interpunctella TaxID=58824 RepID=UPI00236837F4|nr:uncharacterized protein LOC128678373 [Plodia interpunctella]
MELGIVSILIFFHILSPVHMYYVYDETPNVGFVNDDHDKNMGVVQENIGVNNKDPLSYSLHSMYNRPEKFGTGRRFHSNTRSGAYMVDSHFKVLKASPSSSKTEQRVIKFNVEQMPPRITESPVMENRKHVEDPVKAVENNYAPVNGFAPVSGYVRDGNSINNGISHTKPYSKVSRDHHDPYLINVHKTQVTSGQKVKFNGNQFANIRRDDSEVQSIGLQNKLEEVHMQPKPKYQIAQKKLERRHYDATEYQKDAVTSPGLDANLIKLPVDKDNFKINGRAGDVPRIGGWEESVDVKPYALFYRVNQDPSPPRRTGSAAHYFYEFNQAPNED